MPPLNLFSRTFLAIAITQAVSIPTQAATIEVNSALDNGDGANCTLREAIVSINDQSLQTGCANTGSPFGSNDIINIDSASLTSPSMTSATITLGGTQLEIDPGRNVRLYGFGEDLLTISANNNSRVFYVDSATLSIRSLTISQGSSNAFGGGLLAENVSNVSLLYSTISSSSADTGGAVAALSSSYISLYDTTVSNNSAQNAGGLASVGSSILYVRNSTIEHNSATFNGGGVGANLSGKIYVTFSSVSNNSASGSGGGFQIQSPNSSLTLLGTIVSNNTATNNVGGGIRVFEGTLSTDSSTTITGNIAKDGGGISAFGNSINLNNSTVTNNSATGVGSGKGAGIYLNSTNATITDTTISGNSGYYGGGLRVDSSSSLNLTGSTVSTNSAYYGGGIQILASSSVSVYNSSISNNTGNYGAGINIRTASINVHNSLVSNNSTTVGSGGGIRARLSSFVELTNSTVSNNSALIDGAGIYVTSSTVSLNNSTVSRNSAANAGSGIWSSPNASLHLSNTVIASNLAATGSELNTSGAIITSNNSNLIGVQHFTNAQAYVGFTPGPGDITATSDGNSPTPAGSILTTNLGVHGGPTLVHALVAGSPAINKANGADCPRDDQRGKIRDTTFFVNIIAGNGNVIVADLGGNCDIGAVEFSDGD
ncbi:MAG: right-handed parallel beta-helix repeat-containing protein [Methylophagaceae bacterium]